MNRKKLPDFVSKRERVAQVNFLCGKTQVLLFASFSATERVSEEVGVSPMHVSETREEEANRWEVEETPNH